MLRGDRRSSYRVPISRVGKLGRDRRAQRSSSSGGVQEASDLDYQQEPRREGSDA